MKKTLDLTYVFICTFLAFSVIVMSCKTQQFINISDKKIETAYNESMKSWNEQKKEHNNSYEYAVSFSSWVGYHATTTIGVKNGKVISRTFSERTQDADGRFSEGEMTVYTENEANINTHEKGYKATTIDEVYKNCGTKSLQVDEQFNSIYFATDDLGIIKSCSYTPQNCMDDCSVGIDISSFKWTE